MANWDEDSGYYCLLIAILCNLDVYESTNLKRMHGIKRIKRIAERMDFIVQKIR